MGSQADGVIMLLGAEPERAGADFFEDFDEGTDTWIADWISFFGDGKRMALNTRHYGFERFGDQGVGVFAEKFGSGVRDTGEFPAGHGMAAKEERAIFAGEKFVGGLGDANFGAAGVGHKGMRRSVARDFRKKIDCRGDGKRDVNQIGVMQNWRQLAGEGFVDGAAFWRFTSNIRAIPSGDAHLGGVFAKREGEGPADEAGAEYGDAGDEVRGH